MERKWKVLAVVALGTFVGFLDVTIANIAFPAISAEFSDTSLGSLSWVLNGYAVIYAALLVPIGRVADMVGRRRVFLSGLALFTLFSVGAAVAPTAETLIAARVLQGAAAAALVPTGLALLLPEFPAEQRATAVGIWGAVAAVSAALGPVVGGLIVEVADWRWVFAVNLPIGIAGLIAGRRVLVESRDPDRSRMPDAVGAVSVALSVGLLSLGLVQGEDMGLGQRRGTRQLRGLGGVRRDRDPALAEPPRPGVRAGPLEGALVRRGKRVDAAVQRCLLRARRASRSGRAGPGSGPAPPPS